MLVFVSSLVALPPSAMRLDALLKAASTQGGETLRAGGDLGGRIVLIASKPRPESELRDALAQALDGRWRRVGTEWTLDSDPTAVASSRRAAAAEIVAKIRAAQAKLAANLQVPLPSRDFLRALETADRRFASVEHPAPGDVAQARKSIMDRAPAQFALDGILASLSAEALADARSAPLVFSDRPTRLQHSLPASAITSIRDLERRQADWASTYVPNDSYPGKFPSFLGDPRQDSEPPPSGGYRLFLKIETNPQSVIANASFVDAKGEVRQFAQRYLFLGDADPNASAPTADVSKPIALPPEAVAYANAFWRGDYFSNRPFPAPEPIRTRLLAPDRFEPLQPFAGACARLLARANGSDLVAWLPDSTLLLPAELRNGKPLESVTLDRLRHAFARFGVVESHSAGWTVLRPGDSVPNVDRTALATLLRATASAGYAPLEALANDAATGGLKAPYEFEYPLIEAIQPRAIFLLRRVEPGVLALYGSLPAATRANLGNGITVPWAQMSPVVRDRLERLVLSARSEQFRVAGERGGGLSIAKEPTELLGAGTADITLAVSAEDVDGLLVAGAWSDDFQSDAVGAGIPQVVHGLDSRAKDPNGNHADGFPKTMDRFTVGRLRGLRLSISLTPRIALMKTLQAGEFDLRRPGVAYASLPEATRSEIEDYRKRFGG